MEYMTIDNVIHLLMGAILLYLTVICTRIYHRQGQIVDRMNNQRAMIAQAFQLQQLIIAQLFEDEDEDDEPSEGQTEEEIHDLLHDFGHDEDDVLIYDPSVPKGQPVLKVEPRRGARKIV